MNRVPSQQSQFIAWILVLELLVSPTLVHAVQPEEAGHVPPPSPQEKQNLKEIQTALLLQDQIKKASQGDLPLSGAIPTGVDRYWITRQVRRVYKVETGPDGLSRSVVEREIPLHNIDISNPVVRFANAKTDVKINYDAATKELRFDRYAEVTVGSGSEKTTNRILTDSHVILGVDLRGDVAKDANKIVFATPDGVRSIQWTDIAQKAFLAPFTVLPIVPSPPDDGSQILGVEILNRAAAPRRLTPAGEGILDFDQKDGGLIVTVEHTSTVDSAISWKESMLVTRDEVFAREKDEMMIQIAQILITNPDLNSIDILIPYLVENQIRISELIRKREELLNTPDNSLPVFATRNLSQRTDWRVLRTLFAMDSGAIDAAKAGQTAYDKIATAPTDVFDTNVNLKDSQWKADWKAIQKQLEKTPKASFREAYVLSQEANLPEVPKQDPGYTAKGIAWLKSALGLPPKSDLPEWKKRLYDTAVNPGDQALAAEKDLRDSTASSSSALRKGVGELFDSVVTPGKVKLLGALIAGVGINHIFNGVPLQLITSSFTHFIHWSTQVPGLSLLTKNIDSALPYFNHPYAFRRVAVGLAIAAALFPMAKFALKKIADSNNRGWNEVSSFFNYGMQKLYAVLSFPYQRKLFWDPIRQDNIYPALQAGAGLGQIPVVNPFTSAANHEKAVAEDAQEINKSMESDAARKGRAMLIAAAVVSQKTKTDIPSLLMASQGKKLESFANMLQDAPEYTRWSEVFEWAYRGLKDIGDDPLNQSIDKEALADYLDVFEATAAKFKALTQNPSIGTRLKNSMARLWRLSTGSMSGNAIRYLFFGTQSLEVYERFKNAELDADSARIAMAKTSPDYYASAVLYAGQAPDLFGAMTDLRNEPAGIRVYADEFQQIGLGMATVGPDVLTTAKNGIISNPNEPLSHSLFDGYLTREQTIREGLSAILEARLNPDTESVFKTHQKYLNNAVTSFQMRALIGGVCRGMGLSIRAAIDGNYAAIPGTPISGLERESIMLLKKQAVGIDGSGITPGYTILGAYINRVLRDMSDRTTADTERLKLGLSLIETGVRLDDSDRYLPGVDILLSLYEDTGTPLPKQFSREQFSPNKLLRAKAQAQELLNYALLHPPVASVPNGVVSNSWGYFYSFFSSALMIAVNKGLWNPNLSAVAQLPKALAVFAGTYAAVTIAPKITTPVLRAGHAAFNKCRSLLSRKKRNS